MSVSLRLPDVYICFASAAVCHARVDRKPFREVPIYSEIIYSRDRFPEITYYFCSFFLTTSNFDIIVLYDLLP